MARWAQHQNISSHSEASAKMSWTIPYPESLIAHRLSAEDPRTMEDT